MLNQIDAHGCRASFRR